MQKETIENIKIALENQKSGKLEYAKKIYKEILEKEPNNFEVIHLLGLIFYQESNFEKAIEFIQRAIKIKEKAIYFFNLAMNYDALGDEEKAAKNFLKSLELDSGYKNAHIANYNLGIYYKNKREFEKAIDYYNKAIELKPNFYDAYWNRGLVYLILGNFERGWKDYEFRFKKKDSTDKRIFNKPKWEGQDLKGKRILVLSEQGFGDNIQFVRLLSTLKKQGAYVIFECRKELKKLFENLDFIDEIIEKSEDLKKLNYDFYIHLLSLPYVLKIKEENIPKEIYLFSNKEFNENFDSKKFKIGIVWNGHFEFEENDLRSIDFEKFVSLKNSLRNLNIQWFSLQKGNASKDVDSNSGIIDLSNKLNDFSDTAAAIKNLDLVICIDTAVAHLAGAMGKETWVLLHKNSYWRWMLKRTDSPWYSTIKIFRQKENWDDVFEKVENELKKKLID